MKSFAVIGLLLVSAGANAEVVSASANSFEVRETVTLVVPPDRAFDGFRHIGSWWDPQHTYSGDSANLSLSLAAGGCFCERIPKTGGSVEHLRVAYLDPGKRLVLTGALGPLLYEAVTGVMDIEVKRIAGGSQLTLDYKAAGFASGGAEKFAGAVDGVLADQVKRYRSFVTSQPRD
jgi:uncharacterized protein YndB with AHSA1/START domain